jgi:hypothetical protein
MHTLIQNKFGVRSADIASGAHLEGASWEHQTAARHGPFRLCANARRFGVGVRSRKSGFVAGRRLAPNSVGAAVLSAIRTGGAPVKDRAFMRRLSRSMRQRLRRKRYGRHAAAICRPSAQDDNNATRPPVTSQAACKDWQHRYRKMFTAARVAPNRRDRGPA